MRQQFFRDQDDAKRRAVLLLLILVFAIHFILKTNSVSTDDKSFAPLSFDKGEAAQCTQHVELRTSLGPVRIELLVDQAAAVVDFFATMIQHGILQNLACHSWFRNMLLCGIIPESVMGRLPSHQQEAARAATSRRDSLLRENPELDAMIRPNVGLYSRFAGKNNTRWLSLAPYRVSLNLRAEQLTLVVHLEDNNRAIQETSHGAFWSFGEVSPRSYWFLTLLLEDIHLCQPASEATLASPSPLRKPVWIAGVDFI